MNPTSKIGDLRHPSRRVAVAALAGATLGCSAPARATPPQDRLGLRRGIGVHNLLNWPEVRQVGGAVVYDWPPFQGAGYILGPDRLAELRRAGFDFIRLTIDPSIFITVDAMRRPELEFHARGVVEGLLSAGFAVVFDLHPVAVNPAFAPEVLVRPGSGAFPQYVAMVERTARFLAPFSSRRLAFELFNEPWISSLSEAPRWETMLEALHAAARRGAPDLPLVLGGVQWNSERGLTALDPARFRGSDVYYTFHYYEPRVFTHQGVRDQDTRWFHSVRWPIDPANVRQVTARALAEVGSAPLAPDARSEAERLVTWYSNTLQADAPGPAAVTQAFARVAAWASGHGLAHERVLLGEFGCVDAATGAPPADRLRWLATVRTTAAQSGFAWSYWAYQGSGGMHLVDDSGRLDPATLSALGLRVQ